MEHANTARTLFAAIFALSLIFTSIAAFAGLRSDDCIAIAEVKALNQNFFAHFPAAEAFRRYADERKFTLRSSLPDGRTLEKTGRPLNEKIDWLVTTMNEHKVLFSGFAFGDPEFMYMKGELRGGKPSVDNLRSSKRFPKNECVREVVYYLPWGDCVASQRVSTLSLAFVKNERRFSLGDVELFFAACSAN